MSSKDVNAYLLALAKIEDVGPVIAKNLISYCGGIKAIFKAKKSKLLKTPGVGEKIAHAILSQNPEVILDNELPILEKNNIKIISFLDDAYPTRLHQINSAPLFLYHKGTQPLMIERTVGIVGTRKASVYGKIMCEKIVEGLQSYNVNIISGLAYGIDTCAHKAAVKNNIPTIAVLGHGLDQIYPSSNRKLADQMIQNGGLLTEYGYGTEMNPNNFPSRNRIIAGLSDALIVVESAIKGGSMITAEFANAYNKDVFAVPGDVHKERSQGCNKLIKIHKAQLLESAEDLVYIMRWETDNKIQGVQRQLFYDFDEIQQKIYTCIKENEEMALDAMHLELQIPLSQLSSKLLEMEFQGAIRSLPGKRYMLYQ